MRAPPLLPDAPCRFNPAKWDPSNHDPPSRRHERRHLGRVGEPDRVLEYSVSYHKVEFGSLILQMFV